MQPAAPTTDTLSFPMTPITASVVRQYRVFAGGFPKSNTNYIENKTLSDFLCTDRLNVDSMLFVK